MVTMMKTFDGGATATAAANGGRKIPVDYFRLPERYQGSAPSLRRRQFVCHYGTTPSAEAEVAVLAASAAAHMRAYVTKWLEVFWEDQWAVHVFPETVE